MLDPRIKPAFGTAVLDTTHPLSAGMVACWPMDEGSGGLLRDITGNRYDIVFLSTGYTWGHSARGTIINCAGSGTSRNLLLRSLTTGTTFTMAIRLRVISNPGSYGAIFTQSNNYGLFAKSGAVSWFYGGDHTNSSTISAGAAWYDILLSVNAGAGQWYVNGVPDGTAASVTTGTLDTVGSDVSSENFNGQIEYIRFWSRGVSATEAKWLYAEPYAMFREADEDGDGAAGTPMLLKQRRRLAA